MTDLKTLEVWFVTGSQHLYGEDTLRQVAEHSQKIATSLNSASQIPVTVVFKPIVKTTEEIYAIARMQMLLKIVSASLHGCILFRRQKCGSAD